jgi:hypothetical protein
MFNVATNNKILVLPVMPKHRLSYESAVLPTTIQVSSGEWTFARDLAYVLVDGKQPPKKIHGIKLLRAYTGYGLAEAKALIEEAIAEREYELSLAGPKHGDPDPSGTGLYYCADCTSYHLSAEPPQ